MISCDAGGAKRADASASELCACVRLSSSLRAFVCVCVCLRERYMRTAVNDGGRSRTVRAGRGQPEVSTETGRLRSGEARPEERGENARRTERTVRIHILTEKTKLNPTPNSSNQKNTRTHTNLQRQTIVKPIKL